MIRKLFKNVKFQYSRGLNKFLYIFIYICRVAKEIENKIRAVKALIFITLVP